MDNSKLAEKIVTEVLDRQFKSSVNLIDLVTSQLDEVVREAVLRTIQSRKDVWIQEGYAAAREQAAGIADDFDCSSRPARPCCGSEWEIAELIRAMTPGGDCETGKYLKAWRESKGE